MRTHKTHHRLKLGSVFRLIKNCSVHISSIQSSFPYPANKEYEPNTNQYFTYNITTPRGTRIRMMLIFTKILIARTPQPYLKLISKSAQHKTRRRILLNDKKIVYGNYTPKTWRKMHKRVYSIGKNVFVSTCNKYLCTSFCSSQAVFGCNEWFWQKACEGHWVFFQILNFQPGGATSIHKNSESRNFSSEAACASRWITDHNDTTGWRCG